MSEWVECELAYLCEQRKGINYKSEYYCDEDAGYPFLTIKSFDKGGGYDPTGIKYFNGPFTLQDRLFEGDILISVTDLTRAGDIVGSPLRVPDFGDSAVSLASMDCMRLDPKPTTCDKSFLYYRMMLPDIRRQMVASAAGSTVLHLDTKRVPKMKATVPKDPSHQKKIAAILETVDEAIEQTESLIGKYEQVKAGMMQDLFTRGLTPAGKLRPPRDEAPDLYQETPIGWIPKDWELSKLEAKKQSGTPHVKTGPFGSSLKGEHWVEDGHPVITIGSLGEGRFLESELLFINEFDATRLADYQMKEGDVVFSRVADVGRSAVIQGRHVGWIMSSNLMRISLDRQAVVPEFLQLQLSYYFGLRNQIRQKVNSSGRDVANSEILNQLLFVWPSFEEQQHIVEASNLISNCSDVEGQILAALRAQKSGLMQDLLTGKVPVKV